MRGGCIASRRQATDAAILSAVQALAPRSVLDIGCGEGWLARALAAKGIDVTGIDGSAELVAAARAAGGGTFHRVDYEHLGAPGGLPLAEPGSFDVAVCNFSLLGKASTASVIEAVPRWLAPKGYLVIQTLHPLACADGAYRDGWREGSWAGLGEGFGEPAPWYFRTFEGWSGLFGSADFVIEDLLEPRLPGTDTPASVLFVLSRKV
ncbi:class I SAM-dependent methyltransferase [Spiribacter halobius]|uniref:class I SAM-dependent methyltransferase n=1 Tax=Sediminicurvatus halobius TaxID=2182432 RepID=UPI001E4B8473|nr:class I SAM-dependent methyltransferase [Spiribacter halobius]UEX76281.1 class I SAM-dependent methyltransferase [Spiribacter halobius]